MRPEDSLAKMVANLKETTGKSIEEWREVIAASGLQKHGEIVAMIKSQHGVTHGYANQIALNRNPDVQEDGPSAESVFAKRDLAKGVYDSLMDKLKVFGTDIDLAPKKGYISVRRKKQFAILQPAADRLDVGINLPGTPPTARLEASGSFNAMLSHRVRVKSSEDVDEELISWLKASYDNS